MADVWTDPLANYDVYDGADSSNNTVFALYKWLDPWRLALLCNNNQNCSHFIVSTDGTRAVTTGDRGGWMKSGTVARVARSGRKLYVKKTNIPRADEDRDHISILNDAATKVSLYDGNNLNYTEWKVGRGFPTNFPQDRVCSAKVPLGWRIIGSQHNLYSTDSREGSGNELPPITGYKLEYGSDGFQWGTCDQLSGLMVEQIPFDIAANWDTMGQKGIDPRDVTRLKGRWCAKAENIDDVKCTNFYNSDEARNEGLSYNAAKFELVRNDPNWWTVVGNRTFINNVIRGTDASLKQRAIDLVNAFCNTPAGETQSDGLCACVNVMRYGAECLTTKSTLPGCAELKSTLGDLPSGAQVAFSDTFCASTDCQVETVSGNALLNSWQVGKTCPSIQQCITDLRGSNWQGGSSLNAECNQVLQVTGVPPPPPSAGAAAAAALRAGGGTPPASGGTPPASGGSPPASGDTLWAADKIPGLDTKPKQIGFILCIVFFCIMIVGVVIFAAS